MAGWAWALGIAEKFSGMAEVYCSVSFVVYGLLVLCIIWILVVCSSHFQA